MHSEFSLKWHSNDSLQIHEITVNHLTNIVEDRRIRRIKAAIIDFK